MKTILQTFGLMAVLIAGTTFSGCKKDPPPVLGCMDPTSDNYNPAADTDDGSCLYSGCTDPASDNFDPNANTDDGSCLFSGCTDAESENFDPRANVDDGSCIYARDEFIGSYDATEVCTSGTYAWVMMIEVPDSGPVSEVLVKNLGDFGLDIIAQIDGNEISFDHMEDVPQVGLVTIKGSGTLAGNTLNITYNAKIPAFNFDDDCTVTATKQ